MLKSTLIDRLAQKLNRVNLSTIAQSVGVLIEVMTDTLSQSGRIEIRGFGSFSLHYQGSRRAHNPKTGKKLMTAPKYRPHFKAGKELRNRVNPSDS